MEKIWQVLKTVNFRALEPPTPWLTQTGKFAHSLWIILDTYDRKHMLGYNGFVGCICLDSFQGVKYSTVSL